MLCSSLIKSGAPHGGICSLCNFPGCWTFPCQSAHGVGAFFCFQFSCLQPPPFCHPLIHHYSFWPFLLWCGTGSVSCLSRVSAKVLLILLDPVYELDYVHRLAAAFLPKQFLGYFYTPLRTRCWICWYENHVPEDMSPQEVQQRETARTAVKEEHQASGWAEKHISESCTRWRSTFYLKEKNKLKKTQAITTTKKSRIKGVARLLIIIDWMVWKKPQMSHQHSWWY